MPNTQKKVPVQGQRRVSRQISNTEDEDSYEEEEEEFEYPEEEKKNDIR